MGAAASIAVPEQIRFTDLLGLAPLLTQHTPGHTINVTALQLLFKRTRNAEGFVSREQFIELIIKFGESAELRKTILQRSADYVAPEIIIEKVLPPLDEVFRFQNDPRYKDVHFIDFDSFRAHGSYPCFTEPSHVKDGKVHLTLTTPASEINYETSFLIFVSHTWYQRASSQVHKLDNRSQTELHHLQINKEDNQINTHPDTEFNEQYKVCLSGLTKFIHAHFYEDYNPAPWSKGPGAYMNRSWCRIEMFFGSNVPLLPDLTQAQIEAFHAQHELQFKTEHGLLPTEEGEEVVIEETAPVAALIPLHMQDDDEKPPELVYVHTAPHKLQYYSRRHRMSQRLHTRAASEQRPHVIYSSYEYRLGLPPMIVSPISNLYIEKYAPLAGYCSRSDDISIYKPTASVDTFGLSRGGVVGSGGGGGGANGKSGVSFANIGSKGDVDSHNSSSNTLSSYTTSNANSPHPTLLTQNVYKSSVNLDRNYSRPIASDNSPKSTQAKNSASSTPLPQKRDTPAVLIRLNEEVHVLITKGKVGYDGEVNEDGERHGRGIYAYANGEKYVGEWEHGKREGTGHFQHMNGDIYQGEFHQDHECGVCNIRYACGDLYFGELRHRQRHGHGLLEYSGDKEVYEGEFKRNLRHGDGVMKYGNGEMYCGGYVNDMRHGQGVLSDSQGTVLYHGYWQYDAQAPDHVPPEHSSDEVVHAKSSDSLVDLEHNGEQEHEHRHHHKHRHHHHHSRSEDSEHTSHSHHSHHSHHHKHKHHHSHSHSHSRSHDPHDVDEHALHTSDSNDVSRVFSDDTADGHHSPQTTTTTHYNNATTDSAAHTTTDTTNASATTGPSSVALKEQIKAMHLKHSSARLLSFEEITLEHHNNIKTKPKKKNKKVHTPVTVHHSTPSSVRGKHTPTSSSTSAGISGANHTSGGSSASSPRLSTVTENATPHNTPHSYSKNAHKAMSSSGSTSKVHTPASTHK